MERMREDLEGALTDLTFQAIWVFYLFWNKLPPKSLTSTFLFIHLRLYERSRGGGRNLKHFAAQWCHLPGFLGITILVAGSACQPWLTTPLEKTQNKKKPQDVSPPATVKRFAWDMIFITACGNIDTFNCLLHRVSHKSSKVFCGDGRVRLRDQTVRSLSCTLCEYQQHGYLCMFDN